MILRYSSFIKFLRAAAILHKFALFKNKKDFALLITVQDIRTSRDAFIRDHQIRKFTEEMRALEANKELKGTSQLKSLSPYVNKEGFLVVYGRLQRSSLPESAKHPIILDSNDDLTRLIVDDTHAWNGHVGAQHTLHILRKRYWIIHGLSTVKQQIRRCITCCKQRKPLMTQQMAALPPQRLSADEPPFSITGLDFFGPVHTKLARKEFKRYGCLFTCLASRAVHLEMAYDLTTDSFLSAFSRFVARRGRPKEVMSDNGTNFVGEK
jgi:hypothetical protein